MVRDGLEKSVSTYDLLVGDVVIVETGDIVAADGVMVDGEDMRWVFSCFFGLTVL